MSLDYNASLQFFEKSIVPGLRAGISFDITKQNDGNEYIVLQDTWELAENQLLISKDLLYLLQYLNGKHTLDQLLDIYNNRFQKSIGTEQIQQLISMLDKFYLLDTPRFKKRMDEMASQFLNNPLRPPVCAGSSYPDDPAELTAFLDAMFTGQNTKQKDLAAVIVPHIDLRLGGSTYAAAYQYLKNMPQADLYVVLGIGHMGIHNLFSLTDKNFDTPLGPLCTAGELAHAVNRETEYDFFQDELVHRDEHSIEFQTLILKYLHPNAQILPVLCSFSPFIFTDTSGESAVRFQDFTIGLKSVLSRYKGRICYVAGVDLSHVGPMYDDAHIMDPAFIDAMQKNDHKVLDAVAAWDRHRFQEIILSTNDVFHICGYSAITTLMHLLPSAKGRLLDYQYTDMDGNKSLVSFASMVLR